MYVIYVDLGGGDPGDSQLRFLASANLLSSLKRMF